MFLYGLEDTSVSSVVFLIVILIIDHMIRFNQLVYLPEGQPIMDALWEETIAEFEFAGVKEILTIGK
jgi:hypothetical protein